MLYERLTVITPCTRPLNLQEIYASIELNAYNRWIIVHDAEPDQRGKNYTGFETSIMEFYRRGGAYGSEQRNAALDYLEEHDNDTWLLFIDDDTVVHPAFYRGFYEFLHRHPGKLGFIFSQDIGEGRIREVFSNRVKRNWIDMGQFCVHFSLLQGQRFEPKYEGDGIFIEGIYDSNPEAFYITKDVLSYYNYLRRGKDQ